MFQIGPNNGTGNSLYVEVVPNIAITKFVWYSTQIMFVSKCAAVLQIMLWTDSIMKILNVQMSKLQAFKSRFHNWKETTHYNTNYHFSCDLIPDKKCEVLVEVVEVHININTVNLF